MKENLLTGAALLPPIAFALTALASWFYPTGRTKLLLNSIRFSALLSILMAFLAIIGVFREGSLDLSVLEVSGLGVGFRFDAISLILFTMIALIGFIVVKYSINYMDGEKRQGAFLGRLAATIASVQLLVLSGNLLLLFAAWVLTSVCLHRLLVFYPERVGGLIAAKKKFIMARLGDLSLLIAFALLYLHHGTGNLTAIFESIATKPLNATHEAAALLLVLAAALKSAQFPTHGWLIEVMETPTPVSALLHAGLLNAGPFLIIRMAPVMEVSSYAPIMLLTVGGLTALFASIAFLTQTSIKTALSYSSVAHMGFSLFVCGLGVYSAAMLHLVAHSFYKAHAFLSSGSAIDTLRLSKITSYHRLANPWNILLGIGLVLGLYLGLVYVWGLTMEAHFGLMAMGSVIMMGMAGLLVSALDSKEKWSLIPRTSLWVVGVAAAFLLLESGIHYLMSAQVPVASPLNGLERVLTIIVLLLFAGVVIVQMLFPVLSAHAGFRTLAIHFKNGLYANALFDRGIHALAIQAPAPKNDISSTRSYLSQKS